MGFGCSRRVSRRDRRQELRLGGRNRQGRVAGQAEGRRAALSARREATKILGFINTGASGLGAFHDQVQTVAFNPPDENRLVLGALDAEGLYVQSVGIPNNQVIAAREALGAARGACELLLNEGE